MMCFVSISFLNFLADVLEGSMLFQIYGYGQKFLTFLEKDKPPRHAQNGPLVFFYEYALIFLHVILQPN